MLLSCVAILLGVAVIIFIVLTLGMEESHRSRAHKGSMKSCAVEFLLSSVSQRPSKDRMAPFTASELQFAQKRGRKTSI